MSSAQDTLITDVASAVFDLTENLRLATPDPADQIRLLGGLAAYGLPTGLPPGSDPVGLAGYRAAGPSGLYASTARATSATFFDAAGTLRTAPAGFVRPSYSGGQLRGWLDEPAATNGISNPRGEGAVAPATVPTGWIISTQAGLTSQIVGTGTLSGIAYVDVRFSGTTSGGTFSRIYFAGSSTPTISAVQGETWTLSAYLRLAAGAWTGVDTTGLYMEEYAGTTFLAQSSSLLSIGTGSLGAQRYAFTKTMVQPTTSKVRVELHFGVASGVTVDFTIRIGLPQMERNATATTPVLPPVGAPAVATRAADAITLRGPASLSPLALAQADAALATAALCRRAALVSLARAVADYEPASSNEAAATLARILPLFDAETIAAGDRGDDAALTELRGLRAAVTRDLQSQGLRLPEVVRISRAVSQPGLVIAQVLYEDSTREPELTRRVDPQHPLFYPTSFDALSG